MKPLLADFGLAVCSSTSYVGNLSTAGTEGYMAPEVLAKRPYGTEADIWSFNRLANAVANVDPTGSTLMAKQAVQPWLWVVHTRSGSSLPVKRATADQLYAATATIAEAIRGMGAARQQLLQEGRAAQKRIKRERWHQDAADVAEDDARKRNALRKMRKVATHAMANTAA